MINLPKNKSLQNNTSFKVYNASAGSGKTYTLVKYYLKIILSTTNIFKFQEILALTFTNKAAQEMKARILSNLKSFSNSQFNDMALDLGLSLNFDVELKTKNILENAVEILISKIGKDPKITNILLLFSLFKWQQEQTWDVSFALNDIAQMLVQENTIIEIGKLGLEKIKNLHIEETDFSYKDYPNFLRKLINKDFKNIKFDGRLAKNIDNNCLYKKSTSPLAIEIIETNSPYFIEVYNKVVHIFETEYPKYVLAKLIINKLIPLSVLSEINKCLESYKNDNNIKLNSEFNQIIRNHIKNEPVAFIYEKIGEKYSHFFIDEMQDTSVFQWENLIPLIGNALSQPNSSLFLVGDAKQAIYRWRGGKANQFINLALDESNSNVNSKNHNPFFIDKKVETLDTNYRSYSEIIKFNNTFFTNAAKFLTNPTHKKLYKLGNKQEINKNIGGYVQIDFLEKPSKNNPEKVTYSDKILSILENLDANYNFGDVCILVRNKKDGIEIANNLINANYNIVTSDSLLLYQADKVNFVINFLNYLVNNEDKKSLTNALIFLHKHLKLQISLADFLADLVSKPKKELLQSLKTIDVQFNELFFNEMSLYNSVTYFINCFKLVEFCDVYLQFFLEEILNFEQKQKGGLSQFLDYFESNKENLSIVASKNNNAIQILTIHKAKGLEFPVVIFPNNVKIYNQIKPTAWYHPQNKTDYNDFESLLIDGGTSLEQTDEIGQTIYAKRRESLELDNLNLLYVGLTRAIEQLYIITEQPSTQSNSITYGNIFEYFLQSEQKLLPNILSYSFGNNKRHITNKQDVENLENNLKIKSISTDWASHGIHIVSNASKYWNETQKGAAIYGTLLHDILAHIKTVDDINPIIELYQKTGKITTSEASEYRKILKYVVNHPKLEPFYSTNIQIYNECEIVTKSKQLLRLDRLVLQNNTATIIDYKTGQPQAKHKEQLIIYEAGINELNIKVKTKILVYLQNPINVIFVD